MNPAEQFLESLEQDGKGPVYHREMMTLLVDRASEGMAQVFLDACFQAKFVVRTQEVMRRIGKDGEGFDKLSAEFQAGAERTSTLLRTMVKDATGPVKGRLTGSYIDLSPENFQRFLELCSDLSRIKNWEVDGRPLPFLSSTLRAPSTAPAVRSERRSSHHVTRANRVSLALLVLLMVVEPPVTTIGWITAVVIAGLMIVVEVESAHPKP